MPQTSLFADPPPDPGLVYQADVLAPDEERALAARFDELGFTNFEFQRWLARRRVVWFGWRYDYGDAGLVAAPPLAAFLEPLRERAARLAGVTPAALEQTLVMEYQPGAGIGWHRDQPVFDVVVGLSLLTPCTLRLRRRHADRFERVALPLAPRSAYVLTGDARRRWEHSIAPLAALRYSVTFRSLV